MQYNPQSNYGYTNSPAASHSYSASNSNSYANASVDSLATGTTSGINYLLKNNYVRVFIFVLAIAYAGYTVMPVPKNFKKMLDKSYLMKYLILFFVAASMLHPLDNDKLKICVVVPFFILIMFRMMRNRSSGKSLFHGLGRSGDDCSDSESRRGSRRESRRGSRYSETESDDEEHGVRAHVQPAHVQPAHVQPTHPSMGASGMIAAGAVGVGVGAHVQGKRDRRHKGDKKHKKSKGHKAHKAHKGSKRSSSSDSIKGMAKTEHFSFV